MNWMPNKWIAAFLGLFLQPLSMLYLVRVKLAFIYLFISSSISILELVLSNSETHLWTDTFSLNWLLMLFCAYHAYKIAASYKATEGKRPWYSLLVWISFPSTSSLFKRIINSSIFI